MNNNEKKPIITDEDMKLFMYLNTFKFLDYEFIEKFVYKNKDYKAVMRRCNQLKYNKYVGSMKFYRIKNKSNNTTSCTVVFLGEEAEKLLEFNLVDINYLLKEYSEHYIRHQLFLANVMIHYYDAVITDVKKEENIDKEVKVRVDKVLSETEVSYVSKEINIRPDAGIILNVAGKNVLYFIEAERSYSSKTNISRKLIKQYSNFDKYTISCIESLKDENIDLVRVLFISESESKMNNLIGKINEIDINGLEYGMLFIYQEELIRQIEEFNDNVLGVKYYNLKGERVKIYGINR